jgi:hypothetical protein
MNLRCARKSAKLQNPLIFFIKPENAKCAPKLEYLKLNLVLAVELVKKQLRLSSLHSLLLNSMKLVWEKAQANLIPNPRLL